MTKAFLDMLYLFQCSAHGMEPKQEKDYDLSEIVRKAASQGVLPLVLMSILKLYKDDQVVILGATLAKHINDLRKMLYRNMQRSMIISNAMKHLADSGISCCVLKGETVAHLYKNPECRLSGDTDVYLSDEKSIKEAIKILQKHGFEFHGEHHVWHHLKATHEVAGLMEIHRYLYDSFITDIWFDNKAPLTEPFRLVKTSCGIELAALGITDGLIFLYLHMIKHFLEKGVGVRQLMDTLLYIKEYKGEIDFERFNRLIRHLKYEKFFENMIYIGLKYLGFVKDDLFDNNCDEATVVKILTDIECGGIYGKNELWREGFYEIYNVQRFARFKDGDYDKYMLKVRAIDPFKVLFLDKYSMKIKYPYVARHGFLLPIAWLHRVFDFAWKTLRGKKNDVVDNVGNTEMIKARMELIYELDMV